jgi:hypothetical protein
MQATMQATTHTAPSPSVQVWSGRIVSALAVLFLAFDGIIKVLQLAPAVDGSAALGYSAGTTLALGYLTLACLAAYLFPRTAPLGALLLTGYLGGAIATHVRAESPAFPIIFPAIIGAMLWGGLTLRDARLRAFVTNR